MISLLQGSQPEMLHEVAMSLYITLGWDALWFSNSLDIWEVLYATEICLMFFSWLEWSYGLGPSDVSSPGFNFMFHFSWPSSAFPIFRIFSYMKAGALLISKLYAQNPEECPAHGKPHYLSIETMKQANQLLPTIFTCEMKYGSRRSIEQRSKALKPFQIIRHIQEINLNPRANK